MKELSLPNREPKPRRRGLTSVIDWGPDTFGWGGSASGIRAALECAADYIDFAKIYAPNLLLIPEQTMRGAIGCYRDFGVSVYAGGIIFEYAHRKGQIDDLISLLQRLGLDALEISENCVFMRRDERLRVIEKFQRAGFQVIYEYGAKDPQQAMELDELNALVADLSSLGIDYFTLEQSELDLLAASRPEAMQELMACSWFERVLIEADPYQFPRQHAEMLSLFGTEVNLANVTLGQALRLEGLRRGMGRAVGYSAFNE
ncbi:phosphosulfolactate synthase [Alcaligenes endophyticus]|uniref:Phosphosulfolactate synthase n=1 Tax=Alcaligenes endophyticus TaxID=1929088 RepID=A0ABT8ELM8_9BURK|nr:phosphosulfolactate synthase [Alcaligenes endophyticus]MCX5591238.1 phosphosulfolactate synthase [Alcaligenes endophyticus]MDN4122184.1 phosphosulfolactate synthase [Alcaligenes endophyticus]